jgi:hypothetical protein
VNDRSRRAQRVRLRALKSLDLAFKDAGEQLSARWVERDPDQRVFRGAHDPDQLDESRTGRGDREWERLVHRVAEGRSRPKLPAPQPRRKRNDPARYPERPWGDPVDRARVWAFATVLAVAGVAVVLVTAGWWYWLIPLPLVGLTGWRLQHSLWESRGTFGGTSLDTLLPSRATDDMKRRL